MDIQVLKDILSQRIKDCEFIVEGDGRHFVITAISDIFKDLTKLKAQQHIYSALQQEFANGDIHALELKIFDKQSWKTKQLNLRGKISG